jgi:hypothetical protein
MPRVFENVKEIAFATAIAFVSVEHSTYSSGKVIDSNKLNQQPSPIIGTSI